MVLTGIKKKSTIKTDMKKISRIRRTRRIKTEKSTSTWRHYVGPPRKERKYYTCPICHKQRETCNRTEVKVGIVWLQGCQDCFLRSVDEKGNKRPVRKKTCVMKCPAYKLKLLQNIKA